MGKNGIPQNVLLSEDNKLPSVEGGCLRWRCHWAPMCRSLWRQTSPDHKVERQG